MTSIVSPYVNPTSTGKASSVQDTKSKAAALKAERVKELQAKVMQDRENKLQLIKEMQLKNKLNKPTPPISPVPLKPSGPTTTTDPVRPAPTSVQNLMDKLQGNNLQGKMPLPPTTPTGTGAPMASVNPPPTGALMGASDGPYNMTTIKGIQSQPLPSTNTFRRGGAVRSKPQTKSSSSSSVSKASKRGDGIAQRGKTRGRMC